jgi:2-polyprenyl-3-methyl-5-hydroxy-6-metoxy-1,4-benzoquinol methylase
MSNYSANQLVADRNNVWNAVLGLVDDNETVLDIGCSSGNFGQELIERKQCVVDGIDIDEKDVQLAQKKLRNAYVLNVERDSLEHLYGKYDAVLMMDVIEHLAAPTPALKNVAKLLKPGGRLIFSVPNMAHISVRLDLLLGDLDYRDIGLLDDTHLHFYSEKTLLRVLNSAGYAVDTARSITITYPKQLVDLKLEEAGLSAKPAFKKMIAETKGNVYQFVGVARPVKTRHPAIKFPENNPHEEHYKQIEDAMDGQNKHLIQLEKELQLKGQHVTNLEARLYHITNTRSYKLARASLKPLRKVKTVVKTKRKK